MFIIFSILTVAEGGSSDIYNVVSSEAKGRVVVDLHEIFGYATRENIYFFWPRVK